MRKRYWIISLMCTSSFWIYLRGKERIARQRGNDIVEWFNRNRIFFSGGGSIFLSSVQKKQKAYMLKWVVTNIKVRKTGHLARSTTYKKTGKRSSMDHKKSSCRDASTPWEISSKVCWMTFSLSDGVNVVLLGEKDKNIPGHFLTGAICY